MKFFGKYDFVVLSVIIFSMFFLLIVRIPSRDSLKKIAVEINGKESYIFDKNGIYEIKNNGKKLMTIEILDHKVRVLRSTCPDKLCVKSGWLKNSNAAIVCVPNRIVIHYKKFPDFKRSGIDAYTW